MIFKIKKGYKYILLGISYLVIIGFALFTSSGLWVKAYREGFMVGQKIERSRAKQKLMHIAGGFAVSEIFNNEDISTNEGLLCVITELCKLSEGGELCHALSIYYDSTNDNAEAALWKKAYMRYTENTKKVEDKYYTTDVTQEKMVEDLLPYNHICGKNIEKENEK